jgi:hypothetical protein
MDFSFLIVTSGKGDETWGQIDQMIQSIERQHIPNYQIVIIGGLDPADHLNDNNRILRIVFDESLKEKPWTTRKKNIGISVCRYENVVVMHDYFVLDDNWYKGFLEFGADWDVAQTPRLTIEGKRSWTDWAVRGHKKLGHRAIPYTSRSQHQYVDAAYFIVKKSWAISRLFDERLGHGDIYDVHWSNHFIKKQKAKLVMNEKSIVRHIKPHITMNAKGKL